MPSNSKQRMRTVSRTRPADSLVSLRFIDLDSLYEWNIHYWAIAKANESTVMGLEEIGENGMSALREGDKKIMSFGLISHYANENES